MGRLPKRSGSRQGNDFVSQSLSRKLALNAKGATDVRGVDTTCPILTNPLHHTPPSLISYAKIAVNKLNSVNCLCFGMRALIRPATLCMAISLRCGEGEGGRTRGVSCILVPLYTSRATLCCFVCCLSFVLACKHA